MTLPLIVDLPEFDERPELIQPLLGCLRECRSVPQSVLWRVAVLAQRAGATAPATNIINHRIVPELIRHQRRGMGCYCCFSPLVRSVLDLLVESDPSAVLRFFRATREKHIRDDESEVDEGRREYIARAHERLSRRAMAVRLRRPG